MVRVDAVINDELAQKFRMEITKKFGGRKGDLSKALEEAIDLWINQDAIENLKQKALSDDGIFKRKKVFETMKSLGRSSIPALSELVKSGKLLDTQEIVVLNIIQELSNT